MSHACFPPRRNASRYVCLELALKAAPFASQRIFTEKCEETSWIPAASNGGMIVAHWNVDARTLPADVM